MQQRRMPSWSSSFLLTVGLLLGLGCGGGEEPKVDAHPQGQSQNRGFAPDLVIRELRGPASVRFGESFTATVRVCNEGTASTRGAFGTVQLGLYLSTDATLSWPDPNQPPPADQVQLGMHSISMLDVGKCETRGFTVSTPVPNLPREGLYYLGAIVDEKDALIELREDNNIRAQPMGVGDLPDLVITELNGPNSLRPGGLLTHTFKVCNQGQRASWPGIVDVYLSMDADISMPAPGAPPSRRQALLHSIEIPSLNSGHCTVRQTLSIVRIPADAVTNQPLYLGAIVDAQQRIPELREDNNVFVSSMLGTSEAPDLVVTSLVAPKNSEGGVSFISVVTVCNQGTHPSPLSLVALHRSIDGTFAIPPFGAPLPSGQESMGTVNIPPLSPGHCVTREVTAYVTTPERFPINRTYHLAAIVDPLHFLPELREDNNIFVSGLLGVGKRPDLVVTAIKAPRHLTHSAPARAEVTVCNEGTAPSGAYSIVELALSLAPAMDVRAPYSYDSSAQARLGLTYLQAMEAGQCVTQDIEFYAQPPDDAPSTVDTFHLGAIIHANNYNEELRTDNNTFVSGVLGIGAKPDLVITSIQAPPNTDGSSAFSVTAQVCNQGTTVSTPTSLELTLSTQPFLNAPVSAGPFVDPFLQAPLGQLDIPPLAAGACRTLSANAQVLSWPGIYWESVYYLGATVDPGASLQEFRKDNNTFASGRIGLGGNPDLVITALSGPVSTRRNATFTSAITVCNQGTLPSPPSRAQVYFSLEQHLDPPLANVPDAPLPPDQTLAGELTVPALNAGQCITGHASSTANVPADSTRTAFYLGAIVNPHREVEELREDNNTFVNHRIGVGDASDLVVTRVSGPPSVTENGPFVAQISVCNQGTETTGLVVIDLTLSTRPHLAMPQWGGPGDPFPATQLSVGSASVPYLIAGECTTVEATAFAQRPFAALDSQPLYLGAIVDPMNTQVELLEDNNVLLGDLIGVGNGSDLIVTHLSAPANVAADTHFPVTLTVCNQGTRPSATTRVDVYISSEPELTMPHLNGQGQQLPATQAHAGVLNVPALNLGGCFTGTAVAVSTLPSAAQTGAALYVGAIADGAQVEDELREDNNAFMGGRIGVGLGPDLVITALTSPASVQPYEPFSVTVSFCNLGTQASVPNTHLELQFSTEPRLLIPANYSTHGSLPTSQSFIDIISLPSLGVNDCLTLQIPVTTHAPPPEAPSDGILYLGAVIDVHQQNAELRTDNNTYIGAPLGYGHKADLVITAIHGPASVNAHWHFTASVTVCNHGTSPSNPSNVEMHLSTTPQLAMPQWGGPGIPYPTTQQALGNRVIPSLAPSDCVSVITYNDAFPPYAARENQPLYLGAIVDVYATEPELREDNNTFVSGLMGVGALPDLIVTSVSSPAALRTNEPFSATVRVCNQGTTSTNGPVDVELYLSSHDTLAFPSLEGPTHGQQAIGQISLQNLEPGQCVSRTTQVIASLPPGAGDIGLFYLGAIVDPWKSRPELREDNNTLADRLVLVMP